MAIIPSYDETEVLLDSSAEVLSTNSLIGGGEVRELEAQKTRPEERTSKDSGKNLDNKVDKLRPTSFENYIGQKKLKRSLKVSIGAAKKRDDLASLGHVLLYGPPGLGKTSCAYLLAEELGTSAKIISAPALERPRDIIGILMSLNEGDILFIDEIHRLNKVTEELLYPAIEDFRIDLSTGAGDSTRLINLNINSFVLVGATTKLGYISAPLRDRFIHVHRMEYYSPEELAEIAKRSAEILKVDISSEAALLLAKRARSTPRIMNRLLRLVRDFSEHNGHEQISEDTALKALELYHIDELGLDQTDHKILKTVIENHSGGPVGLDTIARSIGEDRSTVEDFYEPYLIQAGLIKRTPRGRVVTEKSYKHLVFNK